MSGIEFANKYAGTRFKVPLELLPAKTLAKIGNVHEHYPFRCRIVGYMKANTDCMVVELEEYSEDCWPLFEGVQLVVKQDNKSFYNHKNPLVMSMHYTKLTPPLTREDMMARAEEEKNKKPAVPPPAYPKLCKICNKPARAYGKRIMCSNRLCGTRQDVLGSLPIKHRKVKPLRCAVLENGKTCGAVAVYLSRKHEQAYIIDCEKGHTFIKLTADLKVNDLVMMTKVVNDNDRVWNGESWELY